MPSPRFTFTVSDSSISGINSTDGSQTKMFPDSDCLAPSQILQVKLESNSEYTFGASDANGNTTYVVFDTVPPAPVDFGEYLNVAPVPGLNAITITPKPKGPSGQDYHYADVHVTLCFTKNSTSETFRHDPLLPEIGINPKK